MKKKVFLGVFILFILIIISGFSIAAVNSAKHPSDYHIGISYSQATTSKKPMLALFYADWCSYCLKFMPRFYTLSKLYGDKFNFVMINIEGSKSDIKLAKDYHISSLPTVYIIDPKYDNRVLVPNSAYQDLAMFRQELDRYLKIRARLDK